MTGPALFWRALSRLWDLSGAQNFGLIAAGIGFFGMLAIFPGLAAVISVAGLVIDPSVVLDQIELLRGLIPPEPLALIEAQATLHVSRSNSTLTWTTVISLGVSFLSVRAGVVALMQGMNMAWQAPGRPLIWQFLVSMALTVIVIGVSVTALILIVIAPIVIAFLPLGPTQGLLFEVTRWAVAAAVILATLSILYRYGPNHAVKRTAWLSAGAFLALAMWLIISVGFSIYLAYFNTYDRVYGSIGAVVALLMWVYLSAYSVLIGGVFNVALWQERRARAPDTP